MPLSDRLAAAATRTRALPAWARYGATIAIVLSIFLVRRAAEPILPEGYPFLLFFVAILVSASLFDHGASLLATVLSAMLAAWFYLPPFGSLRVEDQRQVIALLLFALIGAAVGLVV